jgi:DNA-binding XRE family transcriptional regulator
MDYSKTRLPYNQTITAPMLRYLRLSRNLNQERFANICGLDRSTLAKLERGELELTPHYHSKIKDGIRSLRISNHEVDGIKRLLELKMIRGYKP